MDNENSYKVEMIGCVGMCKKPKGKFEYLEKMWLNIEKYLTHFDSQDDPLY